MTSRDGTVRKEGDQTIIRFERELDHPVETVWETITDQQRMRGWLSEDATVDLRVGGTVRMNDHEIDSTVVALEPPHVFEYGWSGPHWDGGTVRWELAAAGSGTRLVLTHRMNSMSEEEAEGFKQRFPDLPEGWEPVSSTLAGWHTILDRLVPALDGAAQPPGDMVDSGWRELNDHYKHVLAR